MSKKKSENNVATLIEKFVYFPEYKASLFMATDDKSKETKLYVRIDHGRYKGCIITLQNFVMSDTDSVVNFDYDLVYDPRKKDPNDIQSGGHIERVVKNIAKRVIVSALNRACEMQEEHEKRKNNPKLTLK